MPAGTFDMEVQVREFGSDRTASATRAFSIVWSEGFWGLTEEEILDEAKVLLAEGDYDRFKEMQPGDREAHLASFWASHDPSPNSARNELREVFQQRVEFANRNYSTSFERGLVSDRGRIFVRYGQPDEVTREVLPQMGTSLSDVLSGSDIDNPELSRINSSNSNALDTRPYEIWNYTRLGEPLFPERETTMSTTGLSFIFVDEQGIGNYVLRYSSAFKRF
jgi:GWxTD domain-containing protein